MGDYMDRVFVITDGMTQEEVNDHIWMCIHQPAHIIWCAKCKHYRRVNHTCIEPPTNGVQSTDSRTGESDDTKPGALRGG